MMTTKQKLSAAFILLSMPYLLLTACDTKEEKEQIARWTEQASYNAQAYIQQKYGFTAEITEAKVDRQQGWIHTTPLSDVFVSMTHDGRDFTVFITGAEASTDGCDNYQNEEIRQAWFDTIGSEIEGLQLLDIYPKNKSARETDEPLYGTFFDGSNLAEVLEDGVRSFCAYYVRADFSAAKDFVWLDAYKINCKFISCRDAALFDADELTRSWAAPQPVYCDNSRTLSYSEEKSRPEMTYHAYELQKYGDVYYYASDEYNQYNDPPGKPAADQPRFEEFTPPDPNAFNGNGVLNAALVSKAYTISADSFMYVHVYYPKGRLQTDADADTDRDKFNCGRIQKDHDGKTQYRADPIRIVGDYVYMRFNISEEDPCTFMLLYEPPSTAG